MTIPTHVLERCMATADLPPVSTETVHVRVLCGLLARVRAIEKRQQRLEVAATIYGVDGGR